MKPFVGLPVLFTGKHFTSASQKHAAIIVSVQSDSMVNLTVFNEHGNTYGVVGVRLVRNDAEIVGGENYCTFHPGMYAEDEVTGDAGTIDIVDIQENDE